MCSFSFWLWYMGKISSETRVNSVASCDNYLPFKIILWWFRVILNDTALYKFMTELGATEDFLYGLQNMLLCIYHNSKDGIESAIAVAQTRLKRIIVLCLWHSNLWFELLSFDCSIKNIKSMGIFFYETYRVLYLNSIYFALLIKGVHLCL